MSKFFDRLKKQYEGVKISGNNYSDIVKQIADNNSGNIQKRIFSINEEKWKKVQDKYRPSRETRLVLPKEEDIIPARALQIKKIAEQGEFIRDTLREALTKNLRESLLGEEEPYLKKRGKTAGRISPQLIAQFEKDIKITFDNYSRKDPKLGVPSNVHGIAVTEIRSAINDTKNTYTQEMIDNNPHLIIKKKWIQNRNLSRVPRRGHSVVNNTTVEFNDFFKVPLYKVEKGRDVRTGFNMMRYPHDPTAPIKQKANCNCDYDIIVSKKRQREVAKAEARPGEVHQRKDGDYEKQSDGSWEKITEPKESKEDVPSTNYDENLNTLKEVFKNQQSEKIDKSFDNWRKSLNEEEENALHSYTTSSYEVMNKYFREGKESLTGNAEKISQVSENALKGLLQSKVPEDIVVFRTFGLDINSKINDMKIGDSLKDKGFSSTTFSITESSGAIMGATKNRILVKKGSTGASLGALSDNMVEQEFLLPPKTKYTKIGERVDPSGEKVNFLMVMEQ